MLEVASRRWSVESDVDVELGSVETFSRSRRLQILREQLVHENRRSAGPFSHPLATRGPLWLLRDQIRDVSRIADAVATSADSATDARLNELCADLRRLLQTQQRWTERLENQIWRMESQANLMRRLQQTLLQGSPGTDLLWELCELIARETQSIPDGLLLFPEPGQRIVVPSGGVNHLAATAVEHARFSVFAAMTLSPNLRSADLAAESLRLSAGRIMADLETQSDPEAVAELRAFAERIRQSTPEKSTGVDGLQLIHTTADFATQVDNLSATAVDRIVPPDIREFYNSLTESWPESQHQEEAQYELAKAVCSALGLSAPEKAEDAVISDRSERLVLTHKLRWHAGEGDLRQLASKDSVSEEKSASGLSRLPGPKIRRPKFLNGPSETPRFTVFSD